MSDAPINGIWGPDGFIALDGKQPERVDLKPGVGEWLRQMADVAEHLQLGLVCSKCAAPLTGKNSDSAQIYSVVCKCREFVWTNRDYTPPTHFGFYGSTS